MDVGVEVYIRAAAVGYEIKVATVGEDAVLNGGGDSRPAVLTYRKSALMQLVSLVDADVDVITSHGALVVLLHEPVEVTTERGGHLLTNIARGRVRTDEHVIQPVNVGDRRHLP